MYGIKAHQASVLAWVVNHECIDTLTIGNFTIECHSGLVCPASRNISDGVTSPTQHQHWQLVSPHEVHTLSMTCAIDSRGGGRRRTFIQELMPTATFTTQRYCLSYSCHVMPQRHWIPTQNLPKEKDSLPLRERLKHPSLSPASESAPHCRTIALGRYTSITLDITW